MPRLFAPLLRPLAIPEADAYFAPREVSGEAVTAAAERAIGRDLLPRARSITSTADLFVPFWWFEVERSKNAPPIGAGVRIVMTRVVSARSLAPWSVRERPLAKELAPRTLRKLAGASLGDAEFVEADVPRADAEKIATHLIERGVFGPPSNVEYEARAGKLVHVPLSVVRFTIDGSTEDALGPFHVVVSGMTGDVIGAHHPSLVRTFAKGFRKILSFDF